MPVKIMLEDGREFHVGQEVEWMDGNGHWRNAILSTKWDGRTSVIGIEFVVVSPNKVRAIAPKVKRPMTAKEVWSLLQTGVEWKCITWSTCGCFGGGSMDYNGVKIFTHGCPLDIDECTYRTAPDQEWQKFEVEE